MNKKIYALMLTTPLLFLACNSTTVAPQKQEVIKIVEPAPSAPIAETKIEIETILQDNEITVTYVNDNADIKSTGTMHIESFMETLKPTLAGLIQSDNTYKTAMGGCTSMATSMTNDYNAVSPDVKIKRTAIKYRNEKNKPDETDVTVMERFLASNNFKEPLVVEMNDHYRVYKALEMKQPCLACHGTNISADLTKMLKLSYPKDMATNFQLGEFRGVVVANVKK